MTTNGGTKTTTKTKTTWCEARVEIPIAEIFADEYFNSRGAITPTSVYELAKRIERDGLKIPIEVCLNEDGPEKYFLVAGFRRVEAHKFLDRPTIMANIHHGMTIEEARLLNDIENERVNLTPLQEAMSLVRRFGESPDIAVVAEEMRKSKRWVQLRLTLLRLPEDLQQQVGLGVLTLIEAERIAKNNATVEKRKLAIERVEAEKAIKRSKKPISKSIMSRESIQQMISWLAIRGITDLPADALMWAAGLITHADFIAKVNASGRVKFAKKRNFMN